MKVVFVSITHQWVLKSKFYSFFLWVWLDKAKSEKKDEGTKWWWSSRATETDDLCRFSCYSYCSASSKPHLPYSTIPGACFNFALPNVVACCIWFLACIASNLVKLHLLTLHIIPSIMTCLPVFDTYYICLLTMFIHQTNALLYPSSIIYDETVNHVHPYVY